jgi:CheY-like chemotaxis protein
VGLKAILDPAAGPVSADANRLQQVVWNLIANAIKFTPGGGHVQVALERVNSNIEICVADSGIGIQPDILPHFFERFRQADATRPKYGGLGLGLSIVKQIVSFMAEPLRRIATGRQGAVFRVKLPLAVSQLGEHPRSSQRLSVPWVNADLSNIKVLIVDDDPDSRDLVHRLLSDCGATVSGAASAAEALAATHNQRPDILISDIGMPEIDGYQLLRSLRTNSEIRFAAIALTAFARRRTVRVRYWLVMPMLLNRSRRNSLLPWLQSADASCNRVHHISDVHPADSSRFRSYNQPRNGPMFLNSGLAAACAL